MSESSILNLSRLLSNTPDRTVQPSRGPRISPNQHEILRLVRAAPHSVAQHHAAWWLGAEVDRKRLDDALRALVDELPILRTVYRLDRSTPRAAVSPTPARLLEVIDGPVDLERDPHGLITAQAHQPIDISSEPSIRVRAHRGTNRTLLTVVVHPVAADERSFAHIIAAIGRAYDTAATGRVHDGRNHDDTAAPSPVDTTASADAAVDDDSAGADYWATELAGLSAETIADRAPRRPVGPVRDDHVATLPCAIPVDIEQDVRVAALVAGAVYDEWGLDDVIIGLVDPAETDAIGPLDDVIPLRVRIDGEHTARALIEGVAETTVRGRAHRTAARRAIRAGSHPLPIHVALSVHTGPEPILSLGEERPVPVIFRTAPAPGADVSIVVRPSTQLRTAQVSFSGALAGRHDARGFAERLVDLVRIWASGPERLLSQIPRAGQPHTTLLGDSLDRSEPLGFPFAGAPLRPERPALRTARGELTFGALFDRAERLADDLVLAGVAPGDVVAVTATDPVGRLVALTALVRVGAGCALLERDTLRAGQAGIDAALAATRASAVIGVAADGSSRIDPVAVAATPERSTATAATAVVFLAPSRTRVVTLDRRQLEDRVRALIPETPVSPREQVATESSEGVQPQRHAVETVLIVPEIGSADSCAMALAVLAAEGTVVLTDPDERAEPARLGELAARCGAGHVIAAPTTIADVAAQGALPVDLVRLTLVGEPVRAGLLAALRTGLPHTRIATVYSVADAGGAGLIGVLADPDGTENASAPRTETSGALPAEVPGALRAEIPGALRAEIPGALRAEIPGALRAGILGRPVPGMGVRILDGRGRAVPVGVPGEIHLIREGATVPTGDRGMWSGDGEVVGLGRAAVDGDVDGRPVRIDALEEILGSLDGVVATAVTFAVDSSGARVRALLLPAPGADVAGIVGRARAALIDALAGRSIGYTIETVASLPTTGAGILDRAALAAGGSTALRAAVGSGGAPASPTEELVAEAFAAALDPPLDEPVGRTDGFFAIGGDSLAALRLIARLNGKGYLDVDVAAVFEHPTVGELAGHLDAAAAAQSAGEPDPAADPAAEAVAPMAASGLDEATLAALRATLG